MEIFVITSSRADYGLLKPLISKLTKDEYFQTKIIATGAHVSKKFGNTYIEIEHDGFNIHAKVDIIEEMDSNFSVAKTSSNAIAQFADLFHRDRPEIILVLGDRYEIFCAVYTALLYKIPVIHYSGGEKTEGAIDDSIRHSITKMSHLHFVSSDEYKRRVIQLGENPSSVFNVGSLGADNIYNLELLSRKALGESLGFSLDEPFFLVSYHPETLADAPVEQLFQELLNSLDEFPQYLILFTKSNADAGGLTISNMMDKYAANRKNVAVFDSLGLLRYLSAVSYCTLAIGNSSSGLTEVPLLHKPSINIGDRQKGRIKAKSVINVDHNSSSIVEGIKLGLTVDFTSSMKDGARPFGDGSTSDQILRIIKDFDFSEKTKKTFYDLTSNDF